MAEITVLMPVYNSEKTLRSSVESILSQSFKDFEFLIMDDGSSDGTREILQSYSDERIQVIHNDINLKLIRTLNKGIALAKGKFIARMDADDIAAPKRLEIQRNHMIQNPHLAACGTWAKTISLSTEIFKTIRKPKEKDFKAWAWIPTPLIHPTVMIKTEVAKENPYSEQALHCEDYELWLRLLQKNLHLDNIPKNLLYYRVHSHSVTETFRELQLQNSFEVFQKYYGHAALTKEEYLSLIGVKSKKLSFQKRLELTKKILKNESLPFSLYAYTFKKALL